jgi:hypothetical protein
MNLTDLSAKKGRAVINQTTTFAIDDEDAFTQFAKHMITASNFTWRMQSKDLQVHAAAFPLSKGIQFDKTLTLNGTRSRRPCETTSDFFSGIQVSEASMGMSYFKSFSYPVITHWVVLTLLPRLLSRIPGMQI